LSVASIQVIYKHITINYFPFTFSLQKHNVSFNVTNVPVFNINDPLGDKSY